MKVLLILLAFGLDCLSSNILAGEQKPNQVDSFDTFKKNAIIGIYTGSKDRVNHYNTFSSKIRSRVFNLSMSMQGRLLKRAEVSWVFPKKMDLSRDHELFLFCTLAGNGLKTSAEARGWICLLKQYKYTQAKNTWLQLADDIQANKWSDDIGPSYYLGDDRTIKISNDSLEYYFLKCIADIGGGEHRNILIYMQTNKVKPTVK